MLIEKQGNVFQILERKSARRNIFFIASLEVTHRCNTNCEFCIMKPLINKHYKKKEMSLEEYEHLADDLRRMGTYHIQISGGEPLIRPDIREIIQIFRTKYFAVTLNTNGLLINSSIAAFLRDMGLLQVIVSFHTLKSSIFRSIYGIYDDLLDRQINNILMLKKSGVNVVVNIVLYKRNIDEFTEIKHFWESRGINVMWDIVEPQVYPQTTSFSSLIPTEEQLREFYTKLEEVPRSKSGSLICSAGRNHLTFSPYGDIYPCGRLRVSVGNYSDVDLFSLWKNNPFLQRLRKLKNQDLKYCLTCDYKQFCPFCIGNNFNTNLDMIKPVPEMCKRAKIAREVYDAGELSN